MSLFDFFHKKTEYQNSNAVDSEGTYEFCPRCEANITLQKGYSNDLPYWVCRGCGEMLINPAVEGDIAWICDGCEAMLNIQEGFNEECGMWTCTECGHVNKIDQSAIYESNDEFKTDLNNPYKGLSDEDALSLSCYSEEGAINNRDDILLVKNMADGKLYVKKILTTYDVCVYEYLREHPISHMPKIIGVYESERHLIVVEEYISGHTLQDILAQGPIELTKAISAAIQICNIAKELHSLENPIIHRDIKPSNVIITPAEEVYLLDINVAKFYKEGEIEDTQLLGTRYYAAPEQLGYGFSASSEKSDIYAIGMLINVMVTNKLPKEEKVQGALWPIVEKCINLKPEDRYTDEELIMALNKLQR